MTVSVSVKQCSTITKFWSVKLWQNKRSIISRYWRSIIKLRIGLGRCRIRLRRRMRCSLRWSRVIKILVRKILIWGKYFWPLITWIIGVMRIIISLSISLMRRGRRRRNKLKIKKLKEILTWRMMKNWAISKSLSRHQ